MNHFSPLASPFIAWTFTDLSSEVGSIGTVEAPAVAGQPGAWAVQHRRIGAFGQFDASDAAVVLGDGAGGTPHYLDQVPVTWHGSIRTAFDDRGSYTDEGYLVGGRWFISDTSRFQSGDPGAASNPYVIDGNDPYAKEQKGIDWSQLEGPDGYPNGFTRFVGTYGSEVGHFLLDAAGLIPDPIIGPSADALNAAWYLAEGQYEYAALSTAAALPLAGYAVLGAQLGKYGSKAARATKYVTNGSRTTQILRATHRVNTLSNGVQASYLGYQGYESGSYLQTGLAAVGLSVNGRALYRSGLFGDVGWASSQYVSLLDASAEQHVLRADKWGSGGHYWFGSMTSFFHGLTGKKSMFPITWSKQRILNAISEVATDASVLKLENPKIVKMGGVAKHSGSKMVDGSTVKAVLRDGEIRSGFPVYSMYYSRMKPVHAAFDRLPTWAKYSIAVGVATSAGTAGYYWLGGDE